MNKFLLFLFFAFGCVYSAEITTMVYKKVCSKDQKIREKYMKCFEDNLPKEAVEIIKDGTHAKTMTEAANAMCDDSVMLTKICQMLKGNANNMAFDAKKDGVKMLKCLMD